MCRVGAAAWLSHRKRRDSFTSANWWKVGSLLTRIATARDYCADQRRDQKNVRSIEIAARDFLVRDSERHVVEPRTTELRIDHRREQPHLAESLQEHFRQILVRVA